MDLGLHVNLYKCNPFGIGFTNTLVEQFASVVGWKAVKLPFSYLGLPMRVIISRSKEWKLITDNFKKKLSAWKRKLLSSSVHSMLLKSVLGSLGIYYMSLFSMSEILISPLRS